MLFVLKQSKIEFKLEHFTDCVLTGVAIVWDIDALFTVANNLKDATNPNDEITIDGVSSDEFMCFLRVMYANWPFIFAVLKEFDDQHIYALLWLGTKYMVD